MRIAGDGRPVRVQRRVGRSPVGPIMRRPAVGFPKAQGTPPMEAGWTGHPRIAGTGRRTLHAVILQAWTPPRRPRADTEGPTTEIRRLHKPGQVLGPSLGHWSPRAQDRSPDPEARDARQAS